MSVMVRPGRLATSMLEPADIGRGGPVGQVDHFGSRRFRADACRPYVGEAAARTQIVIARRSRLRTWRPLIPLMSETTRNTIRVLTARVAEWKMKNPLGA